MLTQHGTSSQQRYARAFYSARFSFLFFSFKLISERKLWSFHNRSIVVAAVACPEPNRSEKVFTNWNLLSTCALQPNFAPQRTLLLPSDCKYIFVGGRGWNHNIYTYFF